MTTDTAPRPVVSDPAPLDQDGPLWYSDPTGETAVRNLIDAATDDDLEVIDNRGNTIFRIKRNTLLDAVIPHLSFTLTRRGRNTIRAHKKNAPAAGGHQREGENQNPTSKEGTDMSIISPETPSVEPVTTQGMTFVHNPPEDPEELESWRMASALPIEDQIGWQITPTGNGTWGVLPPQIEHDLNLDQLETYAAELAVVTSACCDLNAYGQIIAREVTA